MTPETIQYLVYAALVVGGWFLRHYNVLGLAGDKTPVQLPPAAANGVPSTPVVPVPTTPVQGGKVLSEVEQAVVDFVVKHLQNATPTAKQ